MHQLQQELHALQRERELAAGAAGDGRLAAQEAMLQRLAEEVRVQQTGWAALAEKKAAERTAEVEAAQVTCPASATPS